MIRPQFYDGEIDVYFIPRVDLFKDLCRELLFVERPEYKQGFSKEKVAQVLEDFIADRVRDKGVWVYYPWRSQAIRILPEHLFLKLQTARNLYLITEEEQRRFRSLKVAIAGLSVGSTILETLVMSGGPRTIKLADPDFIELTNLNRMKANLLDLSWNKSTVAARRAWEVDPFLDLWAFDRGLTQENMNVFLLSTSLVIDEMDNLEMKFKLRYACKRKRIPVIMATDIGDRVMIDIERFDLEPDRKLFHGLVDLDENYTVDITRDRWLELSTRIIDSANMPTELIDSISQVGKTLAGVPQLGSTTTMAGGIMTYVARQIACGYEMPSGRYLLDARKIFTKSA